MRRVSWSSVLVVAAAVAVVIFSGYLLSTWPPKPPGSGSEQAQSRPKPDAAPSALGRGSELTVLGDSFSAESSASAGPEWPQLLGDALGWKVSTDAVDGSGYVSSGAGTPFGDRVRDVDARSDVIIVAGGEGDLGGYPTSRIAADAKQVVSQLADRAPNARIVLVSPFSAGDPGPLTQDLSARLEDVARAAGVPYVDATTWLPYRLVAADGVHPTEAGQRRIAANMEQALVKAGVAQGRR